MKLNIDLILSNLYQWKRADSRRKRRTKVIDYERAKKAGPRLKAALTRAKKQVGSAHYPAVLAACKSAVQEWEAWGAWPDEWSRWQRALDDAALLQARLIRARPQIVRLEQL